MVRQVEETREGRSSLRRGRCDINFGRYVSFGTAVIQGNIFEMFAVITAMARVEKVSRCMAETG